ncbi:acyltransferase [Streptococcus didelphis]|uniref:Acyltransferase n=1 Tax=Streptococcus didelphis TaxID=102886 RepID=A0ABY9LH59_9STRE|nr:acyltransferase [Streptococcus didelphis]WMB28205.1 acyltransferase [Streptococcus didelphis]WMB30114.1 acyltransferase [Streptococcus didelphis]
MKKLIYNISFANFVDIKQKISNIFLLFSIYSYQKYVIKHSKHSGSNILIYKPLSIKGLKYMSIGNNFKLGYFSKLEAWDYHNNKQFSPMISIGNNVSFGSNCHIGIINSLEINDNVLIGSNVLIIDHNHGLNNDSDYKIAPNNRFLFSKGPIIIEENVWIGENVSILPGVTIEQNSIIAAGSVVTKNVPANTIFGGNPAKFLKNLKREKNVEQ